MADTYALFRKKAPAVMRKLMKDFGLDEVGAAAVLGNIGVECAGFRIMQEIKPLVPGSKGGYGWCQWTGPRRRSFDAYWMAHGLNKDSDEANYGYLVHELRTTEASAIPAVKKAPDLLSKVKAFELNFERAGVKHYPARLKYAEIALAAYRNKGTPPAVTKTIGTVAAGGAAATAAKSNGFSTADAIGIGLFVAAIILAFVVYRHFKK